MLGLSITDAPAPEGGAKRMPPHLAGVAFSGAYARVGRRKYETFPADLF